ncbi:MAG: hypothetical protein IPM07_25410 [Anaerolineales bacterium]|nr:hypothetical protein [Anaerolineales bacterium]
MTALVRYEAARTALAEAHKIDEVKDIRDKAEAMAAYARQAKDLELIQWATEIKVRAERRAGQMLADELPADKGRSNVAKSLISPGSYDTTPGAKLSDFGVTKDQSSAWQKLAAMPEEHFETAVSAAKEAAGQVTTAFMLREAKRNDPKPEPKPATHTETPKLIVEDKLREQIKALQVRIVELEEHNELLAKQAAETLADNESMGKVFEANEQLAEAVGEAKRFREMNRLLEERVRGLMNEKNEAIRSAKRYKAAFEKSERAAA